MEGIIRTCVVRKLHRIEKPLSLYIMLFVRPLTHSKNACVGLNTTLHVSWMNTFRSEHT